MADGAVPLIPLGTTIAHAARDEEQSHSWCPGDATQHVVRIGPNYKKNGKKAPSLAALYETIGVELFTHDSCVVDVASQLQLPPPASDPEPGLDQGPLPRIIVVNFALPLEGAQMWSPPRDGRNCSLVLIFRVRPETQRAARDGDAGGSGSGSGSGSTRRHRRRVQRQHPAGRAPAQAILLRGAGIPPAAGAIQADRGG